MKIWMFNCDENIAEEARMENWKPHVKFDE